MWQNRSKFTKPETREFKPPAQTFVKQEEIKQEEKFSDDLHCAQPPEIPSLFPADPYDYVRKMAFGDKQKKLVEEAIQEHASPSEIADYLKSEQVRSFLWKACKGISETFPAWLNRDGSFEVAFHGTQAFSNEDIQVFNATYVVKRKPLKRQRED